jgi:hypothetical protein
MSIEEGKFRFYIILCKLPNANDYKKSRNNKLIFFVNMVCLFKIAKIVKELKIFL